jgi:hypothetical protein
MIPQPIRTYNAVFSMHLLRQYEYKLLIIAIVSQKMLMPIVVVVEYTILIQLERGA